ADAGRYPSFVANQPYRISTVRYYGDGQEEADYSGSPTRNIEIDGWGLFRWAARVYVDVSRDSARLNAATKKATPSPSRSSRTSSPRASRSPTRRSGKSTGAIAKTSSTRRRRPRAVSATWPRSRG